MTVVTECSATQCPKDNGVMAMFHPLSALISGSNRNLMFRDGPVTLESLVKKYLEHPGKESFFKLF